MRKLYDAGYDAGVRTAEAKQTVLTTSAMSTAPPPGTRSRASASKTAIDCEKRSASSSTKRTGASQSSGNPNGPGGATSSEFTRKFARKLGLTKPQRESVIWQYFPPSGHHLPVPTTILLV